MVFLLFFGWLIWLLITFIFTVWVLFSILILINEYNTYNAGPKSLDDYYSGVYNTRQNKLESYIKRDKITLIKSIIILIINFILLNLFTEWFYPIYHS